MSTKKRQGYASIIGPGQYKEFDTATCKHCNKIWVVRSTEMGVGDLGGHCTMCSAMICSSCADKPCTPFEKQLLRMEAKDRATREMELQ